ncbi:hypothetical protein ACFL59_03360 [Planctomycetota bacterium]
MIRFQAILIFGNRSRRFSTMHELVLNLGPSRRGAEGRAAAALGFISYMLLAHDADAPSHPEALLQLPSAAGA